MSIFFGQGRRIRFQCCLEDLNFMARQVRADFLQQFGPRFRRSQDGLLTAPSGDGPWLPLRSTSGTRCP